MNILIPRKYNEYVEEVEQAIKGIELPVDKYPQLYEPIAYALSGGGKRLRPVMTLMGCEAMGREAHHAISAAVGIEMFHNFTLLHDDVMDHSSLRRGRATVHVKWDTATAILSGDTMLTLADGYIREVDDDKLRDVMEVYARVALDVYEGQALDMHYETCGNVSTADYIRMISLKTGSLIGGAVKLGAMIGGASKHTADALYDFGMQLGLAFQICDDYLDVYGDIEKFGKPIGGDIDNNKKTWLLLKAMETSATTAAAIKEAMKLAAGAEKRRVVKELYDQSAVRQEALKAIQHYCELALSALNTCEIGEDWKEAFRKLAYSLTVREK